VRFEADDRILAQGDPSWHLSILINGVVKVTTDTADSRTGLRTIRVTGDAAGELASLDGKPRSTPGTAAGTVVARRITAGDFAELLRTYPDTALAVGASVSAKLRWETRRGVDYMAYPVVVRIARLLVELVHAHGCPVEAGTAVGISLSQAELAKLASVSEAAAQRAVRTLKGNGMLVTGYRHFVVRDLDALGAFAGTTPDGTGTGT
jgi:CRP/FNR family transcriptional regulator, cyclic AMP receptor protein